MDPGLVGSIYPPGIDQNTTASCQVLSRSQLVDAEDDCLTTPDKMSTSFRTQLPSRDITDWTCRTGPVYTPSLYGGAVLGTGLDIYSWRCITS